RATNVPVTIVHADGETVVTVDQTEVAPIERLFKPLGKFRFQAESEAIVSISNAETEGYVIVDAVQFLGKDDLENAKKAATSSAGQELAQARKALSDLKAELKKHTENAPPP